MSNVNMHEPGVAHQSSASVNMHEPVAAQQSSARQNAVDDSY